MYGILINNRVHFTCVEWGTWKQNQQFVMICLYGMFWVWKLWPMMHITNFYKIGPVLPYTEFNEINLVVFTFSFWFLAQRCQTCSTITQKKNYRTIFNCLSVMTNQTWKSDNFHSFKTLHFQTCLTNIPGILWQAINCPCLCLISRVGTLP